MSVIGRMKLWRLNRRLRKEGKVQIPFDGILWTVQLWNRPQEEEPPWVMPDRDSTADRSTPPGAKQ